MIFDEWDNVPSPDYVPYTKYMLETDLLLKEFARSYSRDDMPHGHSNPTAAAISRRISLYVKSHWKPQFMWNQYESSARKIFPRYVQGNN